MRARTGPGAEVRRPGGGHETGPAMPAVGRKGRAAGPVCARDAPTPGVPRSAGRADLRTASLIYLGFRPAGRRSAVGKGIAKATATGMPGPPAPPLIGA